MVAVIFLVLGLLALILFAVVTAGLAAALATDRDKLGATGARYALWVLALLLWSTITSLTMAGKFLATAGWL